LVLSWFEADLLGHVCYIRLGLVGGFLLSTGAQLKGKILLLHPTLRNSCEGEHVEEPNLPNSANAINESFADTDELAAPNFSQE
jgi:hypothetical protein